MKLSPLSVPYRLLERGGGLLAAAAVAIVTGGLALDGLLGSAALVSLLGLSALALGAYEVAYYQRYDYSLSAETFDIESGVFARREREIPLRRIQNVDISRNVVQRVLGIAAVDFETAGGSQTEASLRFVSFDEAKRLQREIARLKRGEAAEDEAEPARELFALSDRELAIVGALSFDFRVPGILVLLLSGSIPFVSSLLFRGGMMVIVGSLVAAVVAVILFSWAAGAAAAIVNYYGFRLTRFGDELQYERGLLQRYDGSIPLDKVQTLTIEDTPLKRRFGYATLLIETAGYAPGQSPGGGRGSEAAVPLAERDRVYELANAISSIGDPDFERPPRRVRRRYAVRYLLLIAVVTALLYAVNSFVVPLVLDNGGQIPWFLPLVALPAVPIAAHLSWKHRGYWLGDNHVVTRNGVLKRQTKVVPYDHIQTIIDSRTLFQRRWNIATVTIDTAGSLSIAGSDAAAVDIDGAVADRLRETLDERLRNALAERRRRRQIQREREARAAGASASGQRLSAEAHNGTLDDSQLDSGAGGFVWTGEVAGNGSRDPERNGHIRWRDREDRSGQSGGGGDGSDTGTETSNASGGRVESDDDAHHAGHSGEDSDDGNESDRSGDSDGETDDGGERADGNDDGTGDTDGRVDDSDDSDDSDDEPR